MTQKNPTQDPRNGGSRTGPEASVSGAREEGLLDSAKESASHVAADAKEQLKTRATAQKGRAAERIGAVASALRSTQDNVGEEIPFVGDYAARAAEGVEELSRYIETHTIGELVDDIESFARREPALFFGGAFVLGILGGRFLKSAPRQVRSYGDEWGEELGAYEPDEPAGLGTIPDERTTDPGIGAPREAAPPVGPYGAQGGGGYGFGTSSYPSSTTPGSTTPGSTTIGSTTPGSAIPGTTPGATSIGSGYPGSTFRGESKK